MGWFEEQIRQKIKVQNRDLDDALMEMAEIVVSDREMIQYNDERIVVNNAVQELLRFYHKKELQIPESVTGTEQILDYVCSTAGLMRREVRLEEGWYRHLTGAMLGMLKDSQTMVAILPGSTGKYYYFNAQTGRKVKLNRKTEQEISREAYCFYAAFPEQSVRKKDIKRFVRQNIFLPDVVRTCVSVFIAMLLGLMLSPLTQILYSTVLPGGRFAAVAALLVFMLAVKLSQSSMDMLKDLNLKKITSRLQLNVQAAGLIRILSNRIIHAVFQSFYNSRHYLGGRFLHLLRRVRECIGYIRRQEQREVVHGITDAVKLNTVILIGVEFFQSLNALALGASLGRDIYFNNVPESIDIVTEHGVDLFRQSRRLFFTLCVNPELMDQTGHGIFHTGNDMIFTGIIHLRENIDDTIDINGNPVLCRVRRIDHLADLIDHISVDTSPVNVPEITVNNIGASTGNVEIRLHDPADKGRKTADLSAGAKTEEVACLLIFFDFGNIFRRQLDFCLVEIESTVKIAGKYFFHKFSLSLLYLCFSLDSRYCFLTPRSSPLSLIRLCILVSMLPESRLKSNCRLQENGKS